MDFWQGHHYPTAGHTTGPIFTHPPFEPGMKIPIHPPIHIPGPIHHDPMPNPGHHLPGPGPIHPLPGPGHHLPGPVHPLPGPGHHMLEPGHHMPGPGLSKTPHFDPHIGLPAKNTPINAGINIGGHYQPMPGPGNFHIAIPF